MRSLTFEPKLEIKTHRHAKNALQNAVPHVGQCNSASTERPQQNRFMGFCTKHYFLATDWGQTNLGHELYGVYGTAASAGAKGAGLIKW